MLSVWVLLCPEPKETVKTTVGGEEGKEEPWCPGRQITTADTW